MLWRVVIRDGDAVNDIIGISETFFKMFLAFRSKKRLDVVAIQSHKNFSEGQSEMAIRWPDVNFCELAKPSSDVESVHFYILHLIRITTIIKLCSLLQVYY